MSIVSLSIPHLVSVCSDSGEDPGRKPASLGRTDTAGESGKTSAAPPCGAPALAEGPAIFS